MIGPASKHGRRPAVADDIVVEFIKECAGWSAGINSATFHTCRICGTCVVEMDHFIDANRTLHKAWHLEEARRG